MALIAARGRWRVLLGGSASPSDCDLLKHSASPSFLSVPGALHTVCTLLTSAESLEADIPKEEEARRALHLCPTATQGLRPLSSSVHSQHTSLGARGIHFLAVEGVI